MVRALLDGSKTQTRRVLKSQPVDAHHLRIIGPDGSVHYTRPATDALVADARKAPGYRVLTCVEWLVEQRCPYGLPGDRLWVRETWNRTNPGGDDGVYFYRAETNFPECIGGGPIWPDAAWKPSIHMPRAASRIDLEVTSVRVERLKDISEADAMAEGIERSCAGPDLWKNYLVHEYDVPVAISACDPIGSYGSLWESIYGPDSWAANPWVWVVEFRRAR